MPRAGGPIRAMARHLLCVRRDKTLVWIFQHTPARRLLLAECIICVQCWVLLEREGGRLAGRLGRPSLHS
jgi:hypothetical protein